MSPPPAPATSSAVPGRHPLVAAGAALTVLLGGGALQWGAAFWDRWTGLDEARSAGRPEATAAEAQSVQVRLALLRPGTRTLEEEPRELTLKPSVPVAARAILEALRTGSRQGRGAVLPPAVQVRHVFLDKRGVVYVDLSPELLGPSAPVQSRPHPGGGGGGEDQRGGAEPSTPAPAGPEARPSGTVGGDGSGGHLTGTEGWGPALLAAQAVAATLGMSLPEIAQVQLLIDGREIPVVADGVDLRHPLPASLPVAAAPTTQ